MSEDLIKRSDAIEAMEQRYQDILRIFKRKVKDGEKAIALDMIGCIKSLPSADRPQGEWIAVNSYDAFGGSEELWNAHGNPTAFHYCSECKVQSYVNEFGEELLTDFCPHCGAKMKGADDEVR